MRIGINGRFLVAKQTGVQRAAYNLVKTLVTIDKRNEYFLFTSEEQVHREEWKLANVTVVASTIKAGRNLRNHWWEQFELPRLAENYRIDILYSPANIAPLRYQGKQVLAIYDLCFMVNPMWYSYSFRTAYNFIIPRLARKVNRVITNSNNSRNDLIKFCGINSDKVHLVYLAADEVFTTDTPDMPHTIENLSGNMILYVGSLEPRKNIKTLLNAYNLMRDQHPSLDVKLVLIGCESPLFAKTGLRIDKYKDDIFFKGFVDDLTLKQYYQSATVVAYPSIYEGFGLPPLEAMSCGTPVITSYSSSIPEVVGNAALLIDPFNTKQLADSLYNVITDTALHQELTKRGLQRAKQFNWQKVAHDTLEVFYELSDAENATRNQPYYISFERWKELSFIEKPL